MELRVFLLLVTCYLTCILCRNADNGSTKVFPSINNASQLGAKISVIDDTRTEQSIETKTRPDEITLKDNLSKPETLLQESPLVEDLVMKTRIFDNFKKTKCSRYCVQQSEMNKDFEDIKLILSFANENGDGNNLT
ncbi:PREDICTED: uncharacterized protein LOC108777012 [Cyphomyrmex costatus]|uniref:uncharacterized protein LOC108777012 n=1 Tax=Cyphomyrmex costatus TaxID=456900 RepID=UPI0008524679|nr:PREDICTED: uncharacterized protein LOC108777012 [Cyphomyrmex costatus]